MDGDSLDVVSDERYVNAKVSEVLDLDSLDMSELALAIEDEFEIEIPDDIGFEEFTMGKMLKYIQDNKL
jgi:acyl carrier protein